MLKYKISSVQSLSRVQIFAIPWTAAHQAALSITNSQSPHKLMSIESVIPCNRLILGHPLLLPPSILPSIRVFSNQSVLYIRPKYWSGLPLPSPMTNLDTILKSRDITLLTKVQTVKIMVFPVVMYGCESWSIRKISPEELILLNCGVGEGS